MEEYKIDGQYPSSIDYFEILVSYYENQNAVQAITEERSQTSIHGVPQLTLTYGKKKPINKGLLFKGITY